MDLEIPADWEQVAFEQPDGTRLPAQASAPTTDLLHEESFDGKDLPSFFPRIHGRELFGLEVVRWSVDHHSRTLVFDLARHGGDEPFDVEAVRAAVSDVTGEWSVRLRAAQRRVVTGLVDVPALGWATVRPVRGSSVEHPVSVEGRTLTNGLVDVTIADNGTLRITSPDGTVLDGVGRIVDGGDRGDTYNYAPPGTDTTIDAPLAVGIVAAENGQLLAAFTITREYDWPAAVDWTSDQRTSESRRGTVHMRVELRAGEPFARLGFTIDNASRDHRVRLHVPLARATETSHAEGQFAVVERGRTAEGGCGEYPVPTFPAHGFVDAGGAGVLLTQACEYELLDGELAVTLLRSTGQISRNVHPYREEPAGPQIPTPLAQMVGTTTVDLAVQPHAGDWQAADLLTSAEYYRHPLHAALGHGTTGAKLESHEGLTVTGAILTSLRRKDGALELRIVAQSPEPTQAVVSGPFKRASRVDLLGRPGDEVPVADGVAEVPLRAWEIATLRLEG
jgi:alpha-mannosidase